MIDRLNYDSVGPSASDSLESVDNYIHCLRIACFNFVIFPKLYLESFIFVDIVVNSKLFLHRNILIPANIHSRSLILVLSLIVLVIRKKFGNS